ncbi:hypothetical protein SNK04_013582 [Fusarium graminearum]
MKVAWVKDPNNSQKVQCVATIRIYHAKWKADKIERDQTSSFTFSIALVPFKPICLLSHIVAMAYFKNAFSTEFTTPEKKDEMLDDRVFDIDYKSYLALWSRVILVGGLRTKPKPYSVRVGAGNRLDGALTPAIRGYIFGNTDAVFRKSYIPVDISHDLMGIAYGPIAGENQETISFLHHAFTKRDESAPVYISEEDFKSFEARADITEWRRQREGLADLSSKEAKNILSKIQYTKNVLEGKLLEKRRKEYFEQVDILRSTGQATSSFHQASMSDPRFRQNQSSSKVAEQLAPYFIKEEGNHNIASRIVRYLRQTSIEDPDLTSESDTITVAEPSPRGPTCFLCFKDFKNRSGLTAHVQRMHGNDFAKSFYCPKCKHMGQNNIVPVGLHAWSNHAESFHGIEHSPKPPSDPVRLAHCLLCKKNLTAAGFNLHLQKAHGRDFARGFMCPECPNQSCEFKIKDKNHWVLHVKDEHGGGHIPGAVLLQESNPSGTNRQGTKRDSQQPINVSSGKRKLEPKEDRNVKRPKIEDQVSLYEGCSPSEVDMRYTWGNVGCDLQFDDCLWNSD